MNEETRADYEAVKADVKKLIADAASWVSSASQETKDNWDRMKPILEEKLSAAEKEAQHLKTASAGAAQDISKGFESAFSELRAAFLDAKKHFSAPEKAEMSDEEAEE